MSYIYLDHNSSAPMSDKVRSAFVQASADFGSPSSHHQRGLQARRQVASARESLCRLLHCAPSELVFTSGGTEANIAALESMILQARGEGSGVLPRLVVGAGEHASVLVYLEQAVAMKRVQVDFLSLDSLGHVSPTELDALLPGASGLCLMWANNETGTLARMEEVADRVRAHQVAWHCDGVQALGKTPVHLKEGAGTCISTLSITGHKINAPRGVGALYVKSGVPFVPLFPSHQQENGRRAGTENVAGISAMGAAAESLGEIDMLARAREWSGLRDALANGLIDAFPGVRIHGDPESRLSNTLFVSL